MTIGSDLARIERLPCWRGVVDISPLVGGMTNRNFLVRDALGRHVVRLGDDVPHHLILRWHELAVSRAAQAAGLSPEVEYAEPGVLVMRFIDGRTLTPEEVREPARLRAIAVLLRTCHFELPRHLRGPALTFWPFQVIRSYAAELRAGNSPWIGQLDELLPLSERLERSLSGSPVVFGHNDLLAANLIDDGTRLWLIDWDYAGFGTPLFDLANLTTNNGIEGGAEVAFLEAYFGGPINEARFRDYQAMRVISLLRESLWGMVSELHPAMEFDYAAYTRANLSRLEAETARFLAA